MTLAEEIMEIVRDTCDDVADIAHPEYGVNSCDYDGERDHKVAVAVDQIMRLVRAAKRSRKTRRGGKP